MPRPTVAKLVKRIDSAWQKKINWDETLRDAYKYALPQRETYDQPKAGQPKGTEVFDSTAIKSVHRFANRIVSGLFPNFETWAKMEAGPAVPEDKKKEINDMLEGITKTIFSVLHHGSSFQPAVGEAALDLAAGTMIMLVQKGPNINEPVIYQAAPQIQVALEEGPNNKISGYFRKYDIAVRNIQETWRDAKIPPDLERIGADNPAAEVQLQEVTYYDSAMQKWYYDVIWSKQNKRIVRRTMKSSPLIGVRWAKAANEVQGRGPLLQAMPDIKTMNKLIELVLKNASLAVSGVYTGVDDGVLNPDTVRIRPGAIINVARNQGHPSGPSLAALERAGDFTVAQIEGDRLQASIQGLMLDEGLPPVDGPVRSPTEFVIRAKQLAEDIGAAFSRIIQEFVIPLIERTVEILAEWGIIDLPEGLKIGGTNIKLSVTSPLAQLQNLRELENTVKWYQLMAQLFGPQMAMLFANVEKMGPWMGEKLGVPKDLIRTDTQVEDIQKIVAQLLAQSQSSDPDKAAAGQAATAMLGAAGGAAA